MNPLGQTVSVITYYRRLSFGVSVSAGAHALISPTACGSSGSRRTGEKTSHIVESRTPIAPSLTLLPLLPPRLNKHLDVFRERLRRRRIQAPMACIPSQISTCHSPVLVRASPRAAA
jgi:hypothetical protein